MYGFIVDFMMDDNTGEETFFAWQAEDANDEGIPKPDALKATGETPHEAIANLCHQIVAEGFEIEEV